VNPLPRLLTAHTLFKGPQDAKMIPMVIDTGATTTVIPPQIALAIGCDPAKAKDRVAIITASGLEYWPLVTIPEIICMGHRVQSLPVACHSLPAQSTVEGLLGLDFLSGVRAFQEFQKAILRSAAG
jgi:clan AA aspartic protease (TIGR02281 family)